MKSKMAEAVKLKNSPVAVIWTDEKPEGALQFKEGKWGCVVSMLGAAAKSRIIVFDEKTAGCGGGAAGLGFRKYERGFIEQFLSTGSPEKEGEHYKKTPDHARVFIDNLPDIPVPTKYVVFKPLEKVTGEEVPQVVIFLVNADQLSGLVTLANYDKMTQDNVTVSFGAGCHSTILLPLEQAKSDNPKALIGLTDPSARVFLDKEILSFSVPYKRFLEMESNVEESFLKTKAWTKVAERI
jgi:uncharacterized protein (DUF169 family)